MNFTILKKRCRLVCFGFLAMQIIPGTGQENSGMNLPVRQEVFNVLSSPESANVKIEGKVGDLIDLCIENKIMKDDFHHWIEPFKHHDECRFWQTEFWGKWYTSAALAYEYNQDPVLGKTLHDAVFSLIPFQDDDGYLGNYSEDCRLKFWDVWGRKYTLLGMLAYLDINNDPTVLGAAMKLADHLMTEVGPEPGKQKIGMLGNFRGMPASSILEPIVLLYKKTGEQRYLDFAQYIVEDWETAFGPKLISKALTEVPVAERFIPTGSDSWWSWNNGQKAYEMMSCYDGLLELYRITGKKEFLKATEMAWQNIQDTEMFIVGSGSSHECWFGGKSVQALPAKHTQETCVTVYWLKLTYQLLKLTGDPKYADQLEIISYNALLGSMKPDGSDFCKYTPLEGIKLPGIDQCGMNGNCCNANGPRGIMYIPKFAIMEKNDGLVLNLYNQGEFNLKSPDGDIVHLNIDTDYPVNGKISLSVHPEKPGNFKVYLRIPEWSANTSALINDSEINNIQSGEYLVIDRKWKKGDRIILDLDMRGRIVELKNPAEGQPPYFSILRGPIVLAKDSRLSDIPVDEVCSPKGRDQNYITLRPVENKPDWAWMSFEAGFSIGSFLEGHYGNTKWIPLCDFMSAGNSWDYDSRFRVWYHQVNDPSVGKTDRKAVFDF
jgi:uncharacterized protein